MSYFLSFIFRWLSGQSPYRNQQVSGVILITRGALLSGGFDTPLAPLAATQPPIIFYELVSAISIAFNIAEALLTVS
jgi:hypothetical protein